MKKRTDTSFFLREKLKQTQGGDGGSLKEQIEAAESEYRATLAEAKRAEDEAAQPRPPDAIKGGIVAVAEAARD
ncbi:MAG: hypothetical protein ACLQU5_00080 [Isosphaeraceae bacterium]